MMKATHAAKQQLLFEIEQLPNAYIPELQNFIRYLKFKQSRTGGILDEKKVRSPEHDPILNTIGSIDTEPFSETVDEILYSKL